MKLIVAMAAFMAMSAQAGTLKTILKNAEAPKGYTYLGIFSNKVGDSDYVVAFSEGSSRALNSSGSFYTYDGAQNVASDGEVKVTSLGVKRDVLVKLTFADVNNKKIFEGNYVPDTSAIAKKLAKEADIKAEAKFDKYRKMDNPSTPAEVRNIFRQLEQDHGYSSMDEEGNLPFPTFDLQIEFYIGVKAPSIPFANANVTMAGTDAISKSILKKSKWYKSLSDAMSEVEARYEGEYDSDDEKVFASFSNKVTYEGLAPRLKKAISKHLKTEILEAEGFNCEDSVYTWVSATWILKDGSSVSYAPGTECD